MKNLAVFGSTGSIGRQTLSVCDSHREEFCVHTLVFGSNIEAGVKQIIEYDPEYVGVFDETAAASVRRTFPNRNIVSGPEVWQLAGLPEVDTVVNGVSGFNGTFPLIEALKAGLH